MERKYITDTDFLPQELTHYHYHSNEITAGLYQIVFGLFLSSGNISNVYDTLIKTANKEKNATILRFKLRSWKKSIDNILKTLSRFKSKDTYVIIYIPYAFCEMTLSDVELYFELEKFTIDEILENNSVPEPSSSKDVNVPDIKTLFEKAYDEMYESLDGGKPVSGGLLEHSRVNHLLVQDEMYRRGIWHFKYKDKDWEIQPSQYYGNRELYKQLFIDNGMQRQNENSEITLPQDTSNTSSPYDNDKIQTRAAVMYYMLDSFCPITEDNFNRAVAMIDFAVGKQSPKFNVNKANDTEINKANNNNSIKKYIRTCRDDKNYLELPTSDKVRARLMEQGFDIPSSDGTKHT